MNKIDLIIKRHREGDSKALNELIKVLYPELKQIARQRRNQIKGHTTLTPTSILNEAYLKVVNSNSLWKNQGHFYSVMSLAMRHFILTYITRKKNVEFIYTDLIDEFGIENICKDITKERTHLLLTIDQLLNLRTKDKPEEVEVVQCRIFLGLSLEETAEKLEISESTVKRRWKSICDWMKVSVEQDS